MQTIKTEHKNKLSCYHCGDDCPSEHINIEGKSFCCQGCKTVFEILSESELCNYYSLENKPGINMRAKKEARFDYLEDADVIERLLDYQDEKISKVQFYLPQIHCSACLWLLENLYKLNPSIQSSRVNFLKKELYLSYTHQEISLKQIVELLSSIGYEPSITLDQMEQPRKKSISRRLIYQVGLAGFAFGNIMLLSLPEYFGLDPKSYASFSGWFGWINLILATPVALYSGWDYFQSAFKSIQQRRLNIDVPIALGVLVLYLRSTYEIISQTGAGYFDSLCGLLFFLLLGRIFQEKVYHRLSFERDYRSYFPISITKLLKGKEYDTPINKINKGDRILIRNGELIPVDGYLIKGKANIDSSFATGEAEPVRKKIGSKIYAGGRQMGEAIQLEVNRPLNQSKLNRLWSEYEEKQGTSGTFSLMTDKVSQWFTPAILIIALAAGIYHWPSGMGHALEVMSAVLIVACPCALALAAPFTFGHAMRWLGRQNCFVREAHVIEKIAGIDYIVFDKTGTLTYGQKQKVLYTGEKLNHIDSRVLRNLVNQSNHPLSRLIKESLPEAELMELEGFKEHEGAGIEAFYKGRHYRLGSATWLNEEIPDEKNAQVLLQIDEELMGYFTIEQVYRKGLYQLINRLVERFKLSMLSGDNDHQKQRLSTFFPKNSSLLFEQKPEQKLEVIKAIQHTGHQAMMIGDGLNDAGALQQADVGVVIAENVNAFSPACDVILGADQFHHLDRFLRFARQCKTIVVTSFIISFLYNIIGLSFAVQGLLSPVFAAILMPLSSVSVVGFVSLAVGIKAFQLKG